MDEVIEPVVGDILPVLDITLAIHKGHISAIKQVRTALYNLPFLFLVTTRPPILKDSGWLTNQRGLIQSSFGNSWKSLFAIRASRKTTCKTVATLLGNDNGTGSTQFNRFRNFGQTSSKNDIQPSLGVASERAVATQGPLVSDSSEMAEAFTAVSPKCDQVRSNEASHPSSPSRSGFGRLLPESISAVDELAVSALRRRTNEPDAPTVYEASPMSFRNDGSEIIRGPRNECVQPGEVSVPPDRLAEKATYKVPSSKSQVEKFHKCPLLPKTSANVAAPSSYSGSLADTKSSSLSVSNREINFLSTSATSTAPSANEVCSIDINLYGGCVGTEGTSTPLISRRPQAYRHSPSSTSGPGLRLSTNLGSKPVTPSLDETVSDARTSLTPPLWNTSAQGPASSAKTSDQTLDSGADSSRKKKSGIHEAFLSDASRLPSDDRYSLIWRRSATQMFQQEQFLDDVLMHEKRQIQGNDNPKMQTPIALRVKRLEPRGSAISMVSVVQSIRRVVQREITAELQRQRAASPQIDSHSRLLALEESGDHVNEDLIRTLMSRMRVLQQENRFRCGYI